MGNEVELTIAPPDEDKCFVVTNKQFQEMKRYIKSNDESTIIDAKKHDENTMEVYSMYARGMHGEFTDFIDVAKNFPPVKGTMKILYHDIEAPEIKRMTVKERAPSILTSSSVTTKQKVKQHFKTAGKMQSMSGWHKQRIRHSKARKYGHAGGVYKSRIKKRW
jgi:hypothetical protein